MRVRVAALLVVGAVAACDKPQDSAGTAASASATATASAAAATSTATASAASGADAGSGSAAASDTIIAQHVLVAYKGAKNAPKGLYRTRTEARTRAYEALGKIKGGMSFEDAVKQYSDDTGSVDRQGSIGKRQRQDLDPAFANAAFALKVGDVSDVVESAFGFHIIKRTQ